ncbi:hypothetical protein SAMN05660461_1409 [Chitinophaga ginsengisegetis]|jgi:hypothetical protein|uniref:Uncharacterized protein n=1 Tax=Chitinophaga ginsengisegetis TaxID=393003 RepID=A0A1T5NGI0_9BACT|nr:hypothetical protein [Chitinophaga ginsengisegetis]SKC99218.1 hypothetical protein SAMN05660461_1409 [Chitinophaga ginsengisegetis]
MTNKNLKKKIQDLKAKSKPASEEATKGLEGLGTSSIKEDELDEISGGDAIPDDSASAGCTTMCYVN